MQIDVISLMCHHDFRKNERSGSAMIYLCFFTV